MTFLPTILRILAFAIAFGVTAFWVNGGSHTGWSMNKVPVILTDEITGIEYTEYEDRYVPGIEVLGGGWVAALVLGGISVFIKSRQSRNNS
jgi:hypothetical protein